MPKDGKKSAQKRYNLKEFKDTFLPNRDIESLEHPEPGITREEFIDVLRRVTTPQEDRPSEGKSES